MQAHAELASRAPLVQEDYALYVLEQALKPGEPRWQQLFECLSKLNLAASRESHRGPNGGPE